MLALVLLILFSFAGKGSLVNARKSKKTGDSFFEGYTEGG